MYSEKQNILQLVSLLEQQGVRTVVLCPGSRNTPLIHTFVARNTFECISVTDERSAGFMALGLAQERNAPVAVCCTSGTALLNLHPAVCEAFYQQIPLIVISADRPQAWIGQMDGQTLPQPGVFGNLVKKSVHLPEIMTGEDAWYVNRITNEALLACTHRVGGPVHINLALSEPLFRYPVTEFPAVRCIRRITPAHLPEQIRELQEAPRIMILCGQLTPAEARKLQPLLQQTECTVLSEHLGNLHFSGSRALLCFFDAALSRLGEKEMEKLSPDLLVTMGGHIVSKRLKKMLRKFRPKKHWHISPQGDVVDLFCALTHVLEMRPEDFLEQLLVSPVRGDSSYRKEWECVCRIKPGGCRRYSALMAVEKFMQRIPEGACLHLANSSSVRMAALFRLPQGTSVYCNRGTSGIEGSLSTAVGYASVSSQMNFVLTGDLSFFYDMNALWHAKLGANLRILLLNNGGGGIFHTLPGMDLESPSCRYVEASHSVGAGGWVKDRGIRYIRVTAEEQLEEALCQLVATDAESPVLVEVFTDIRTDAGAMQEFFKSLEFDN